MSKTIRRTIDPKVLKGHPPLNMSPRAIMEPRMDTNGTTKGKFRTTKGHEWTRKGNSEPRMDTNGHEWVGGNHETHEIHEREIQNHEWTRMDTNGKLRTTNGHEWARMGGRKPRNTRNTRKENQNHEWTRMDTKRWEGTTKYTKYTKGKLRTTKGHERTRMGGGEPRNTRKARKDNPEDFVPPNDLFCRQRPGGCREWRLHSIIRKR